MNLRDTAASFIKYAALKTAPAFASSKVEPSNVLYSRDNVVSVVLSDLIPRIRVLHQRVSRLDNAVVDFRIS